VASLLATAEPILHGVNAIDAVSLRSRRRKLELLLDELRPTREMTVLDVGADELGFGEGDGCSTLNFLEELYPWPDRITALGLHDGRRFRERYPAVTYVQGDALALPFADGAFDIVFSNAVIEHVGGREQQRRFVTQALRVGRQVFITTPNRRFPVEVHTRLPFVHWLPRKVSDGVYQALRKGFATEVHLLTARGLRSLFPGRVRIVNLGLTLVAIVD
jgi:SAM-dependent methyltransferase